MPHRTRLILSPPVKRIITTSLLAALAVVTLNAQAFDEERGRAALKNESGAGAIESAAAQEYGRARVWQMTGPFGGDVATLAVDPRDANHLLVGTNDGQLFRSGDGGVTWKRVAPGLRVPGYSVRIILFDRERAGLVYAGLSQIKDAADDQTGGGVFISHDNGQTWREVEAMRGRAVRGFVQASKDLNVLAVAAKDGVYRTLDHGATWQKVTPDNDPELRGFHSVAIDPRDVNIIYVGTWHLPWKTTDGGQTWKRAGSKETGMIDDSDIFAIRIDEQNPDTVLMSACSGIYRSTDASAKWTKIQGIPYTSRRTHVIYQHPTRPEVIFAGTTEGLWRSTDGGQTWGIGVTVSRRQVINAVAVHPEQPDRVYLGTEDSGILVSTDGGETFDASNAGFIHRQARVVVSDRTERGRVYAGVIFDGVDGGFFVSEDGGVTWQQSGKGMGQRDVYSIYQSASQPDTIYAGTNHGVFRSDDRGRTWSAVRRETEEEAKKRLEAEAVARGEVKPAVRRVVQTRAKSGAKSGGKRVAQAAKGRGGTKVVAKRKEDAPQDEGWRDLQSQVFALGALAPRGAEEQPGLIAATWDGLFISRDQRKGWLQVKLGADAGARPHVNAVATSPHAPGLVLIGAEEGLFVSRDGGETFAPLPLDGEAHRVQAVVFDPRNAERIYVGTADGFFISDDGGKSWDHRGAGLRLSIVANAVMVNPLNPDELYVGDQRQGGLFHSTDGGRSWEQLKTADLPSPRFWSLTADPFDENRLYAGSFSGGVYVMNKQAASRKRQVSAEVR
jgi:photosystem II stability/assembly factor-like uncharacterized protein